jgi:hypothetical protein
MMNSFVFATLWLALILTILFAVLRVIRTERNLPQDLGKYHLEEFREAYANLHIWNDEHATARPLDWSNSTELLYTCVLRYYTVKQYRPDFDTNGKVEQELLQLLRSK